MTIEEYRSLKLTDEERALLREINAQRDFERELRSANLQIEEQPILKDLHDAGYRVNSVWNFVNMGEHPETVVEILLRHLDLPYSDRTREGLARAIAFPGRALRSSWSKLVAMYCNAPQGWGIVAPGDKRTLKLGAKDGLACALVAACTEATLPRLIQLLKDPQHGPSRVLLLMAIKKSRNQIAKDGILELASDPDLCKEIASWNRRRGKSASGTLH